MHQTGMVQEAPEQDGRDAVEEPEREEGAVAQCLKGFIIPIARD